MVENIDEMHFIINYDDGKRFGFRGDHEIRYADVVSGGQCITILVRVSGRADGHIHPPLMIFQKERKNYPILSVPDDARVFIYRT